MAGTQKTELKWAQVGQFYAQILKHLSENTAEFPVACLLQKEAC